MNMKKILKDESGIALITALLIMILITVLGTAAIQTSTTDVKIGENFKNYSKSFYAADGAVGLGPNLLDRAFDILETNPDATSFTLQSDIDMTTTANISGNVTNVTSLMTELKSSTPNSAATIDIATDSDIITTVGGSTTTTVNISGVTTTSYVGGYNVNIDVDYVAVARLAGGSTESQSRYEGIGAGGSAFADQYRIHGVATSNTGSSQTRVQTLYQRIQK